MRRKATAQWNGNLKEGKGSLTTDSTALDHTQYSFSTRFENGIGTNPEELLAAAHAGCFTMQLSAYLSESVLSRKINDSVDNCFRKWFNCAI
jgi:osmotically inducible protein OsmC